MRPSFRPGDRVAVLSFNTSEEGRTKLATVGVQSYLTDDREALMQAVQNIGASNVDLSGARFRDVNLI